MGTEIEESTTIRLSIQIDRDINDQFTGIMPSGLKAQAIRCLVELVVQTQRDLGTDVFLIQHLINNQCKLIVKK